MCRSIKTLRPPFQEDVSSEDISAAALQYVRKISGFRKPSHANERAFNRAVDDIAHASAHLLDALVIGSPAGHAS